jgi:streptogramin lyase
MSSRRRFLGARRSCCVAGLLLAAACSTSATGPAGPNSLTITVQGTPSGTNPSIVVSGPDGYTHTLSGSATLSNLAPGNYTLSALAALSTDPIVSGRYTATISANPVQVTSSAGASTHVTYARRLGTGALWIVGGTNSNGNVLNWGTAYTASQLTTSGSTAPAVTLGFPETTGLNIDASGVAFDTAGNMWVVNDNSNTVVEYTPAQLASSSNPTPSVTLSGPALGFPYALAFDASGDLWVANININTIVEFTSAQLLSSGTPDPVVTITENPNAVGEFGTTPAGLAFDPSGNLWVTHNGLSTVVEYAKSQLAATGTLIATITLSSPGFVVPQGIAFDSHGGLWVANTADPSGPGTIVGFAPTLLSASGSPSPTITLTPSDTAGALVTGVAFDNSGNLWYTVFGEGTAGGTVGEYTAAALSAGGSPQPAVLIKGGIYGVGLAFDPHSGALPLH